MADCHWSPVASPADGWVKDRWGWHHAPSCLDLSRPCANVAHAVSHGGYTAATIRELHRPSVFDRGVDDGD